MIATIISEYNVSCAEGILRVSYMERDQKKEFFYHESACIENCDIGKGTFIWHFVHIRDKSIIGENCNIGQNVYIDRETLIGNNVKIQNYVSIYKGVTIENDVFIGPSATFTNDKYPRSYIWSDDQIRTTIVRKCASVGANSTIICGVDIGEYAMVGAGSIVSKDVVPHSLVYGIPAIHRGWVCYCGKPLSKEEIVEDENHGRTYRCLNCYMPIKIEKRDIVIAENQNTGSKGEFDGKN